MHEPLHVLCLSWAKSCVCMANVLETAVLNHAYKV
jgi:hypothetical protein